MNNELLQWRTENLRDEDGILVATDQKLEWMLPWWWDGYSRHNPFPVAFIDLGMSKRARTWCRERGEVISYEIQEQFIQEPESNIQRYFEELNDKATKNYMIETRTLWFQKPFICLKTPYERTLWLDLDCEVRGNVLQVFSFFRQTECEFAICRDTDLKIDHLLKHDLLKPGEKSYSSAVFAYIRNSSIINEWTKETLSSNQKYVGDQNILSSILRNTQAKFVEMPNSFNWHFTNTQPQKNILIRHWAGIQGKKILTAFLTNSRRV